MPRSNLIVCRFSTLASMFLALTCDKIMICVHLVHNTLFLSISDLIKLMDEMMLQISMLSALAHLTVFQLKYHSCIIIKHYAWCVDKVKFINNTCKNFQLFTNLANSFHSVSIELSKNVRYFGTNQSTRQPPFDIKQYSTLHLVSEKFLKTLSENPTCLHDSGYVRRTPLTFIFLR